MDRQALKVPGGIIDAPKKMFFWDVDVFAFGIVGLGFGIFSHHLVLCASIGFLVAWRWGKFKSGKHPWFFIHAIYWFAPISEKNPRIPETHHREFLR